MSWFPEDKSLRIILVSVVVLAAAASLWLLNTWRDWRNALDRFTGIAGELNRLERLTPYPSVENLEKTRTQIDDYAVALARLKANLQGIVLPIETLAPNEFQSRLRITTAAVAEKARKNKIKLPDKFYLGFEEYSSALPNTTAAPLLGQELAQVELLVGSLFEARIDALTSFRRIPIREEREPMSPNPTATNKPAAPTNEVRKVIERSVIEIAFVSTPSAARQFLNQIAGSGQQFFIIRLLRVRNEKDKGPTREVSSEMNNPTAIASSHATIPVRGSKPNSGSALNFIVGNERIEVGAKIEMVRFKF